jgi:putative Ca2+/H+ antiporter (TMEM165/GDT1 family)
MKFSSLLAYSILVSTAVAVYPPPTDLDNNNTDDLVTIQSLNGDVADVPSNNHHTSSNLNSETDANPLLSSSSSKSSSSTSSDSETLSPFYSFYLAISMIVVSEIGDKTFLIAAIMAMRYPRMVVFSAASSALVLMTILSGAIGHILPQLLSPTLTRAAASILFLVFGVNLLREGLSVDKNQGVEEELAEVEEEIAAVELNELTEDIEKGKTQIQHTWTSRIKNLISYVSSPIWFQTFSMTFLGEWGDRSQITTIAMAAGADWISIVLGGSVGHVACTLMAVLGGQYISTKISLRTILLGGSFAFFIFSGLYCYSAIYE